MSFVLPQNEKYLRDAFGSALRDGACILDGDRQVGYVRLEYVARRGLLGRLVHRHPTRGDHPLHGKVMTGLVEPSWRKVRRDREGLW